MVKQLAPTAKRPHVHVIQIVKKPKTKYVDEQHFSYYLPRLSIENLLDELLQHYQFVEYNKSYAFYKDGATEYIRLEGTLLEDHLKLTMDVFSCYCEPLNENQEPPF